MALQTENGWFQIPASQTVREIVPGTNNVRLEIQRGIPATILNAWASWYHKNVEDIEYNYNNGSRDDWAWSATNDVWNSNHLSGTALDLNATKYPWGTYKMPAHQVTKVREGLRLFEGTIFWGRDWGKPDEMHFQLNYGPNDSRNKVFADKLSNGYLGIYGPPKPVETAIQAKRRDSPWLGSRISSQEELSTPDVNGRFCYYQNGAIYWTKNTGACAIPTEILEKYASLGHETSFLKYPTSDVFSIKDGEARAQRFQGGSIYWSEDHGAVLVYGRIGAEWASWNWERGFLGLPVKDPEDKPGYSSQQFEGGKIYWSNKTDAHAIYGMILDKFEKAGVEKWGLPLKAEGDTQDMRGRYQNFEFSTLYYKWETEEAFGVKDRILKAYKLVGYEVGKLGYPISDEVEVDNGVIKQRFENGHIEVTLASGDVEISIDGEAME